MMWLLATKRLVIKLAGEHCQIVSKRAGKLDAKPYCIQQQ